MDHWGAYQRSILLSQPFWHFYTKAIGPNSFTIRTQADLAPSDDETTSGDSTNDVETSDYDVLYEQEHEDVDEEYLKFIRITREHQAERERLKRLEPKKKITPEEYYKDLSQVDTLVEDNLVEAPIKAEPKTDKLNFVEFYGSQQAYDKVHSMEMHIDEYFHEMCEKLKPKYWPAMPINVKPYLNSCSET